MINKRWLKNQALLSMPQSKARQRVKPPSPTKLVPLKSLFNFKVLTNPFPRKIYPARRVMTILKIKTKIKLRIVLSLRKRKSSHAINRYLKRTCQ